MAMNLGKNRARLTRRGLVFVIINVILAVSAWNTAIYVYYIVLAATGAILIVSWFSPRRALALLAAERAAPQAVHRNTRFPMTIRLRNRSRWVPAVYVRIRLCNPLSTQVSLIPAIAVLTLFPYTTLFRSYIPCLTLNSPYQPLLDSSRPGGSCGTVPRSWCILGCARCVPPPLVRFSDLTTRLAAPSEKAETSSACDVMSRGMTCVKWRGGQVRAPTPC